MAHGVCLQGTTILQVVCARYKSAAVFASLQCLLMDTQSYAEPFAVFTPKRFSLNHKCHPYTEHLTSETHGDSTNPFPHGRCCGSLACLQWSMAAAAIAAQKKQHISGTSEAPGLRNVPETLCKMPQLYLRHSLQQASAVHQKHSFWKVRQAQK